MYQFCYKLKLNLNMLSETASNQQHQQQLMNMNSSTYGEQKRNGSTTNNIRVVIRIKPLTDSYQCFQAKQQLVNQSMNTSLLSNGAFCSLQTINKQRRCILDVKEKKTLVIPSVGNQGQQLDYLTFDYVANEDSSQNEIFQVVGKPIIDQCLLGYNGSIFAYGQSGSGKTFTIQGKKQMSEVDKSQRGLLPRCFEYLFQQILKIKNSQLNSGGRSESSRKSQIGLLPKFEDNVSDVQFEVKCSYLEIYNENLIDLLDVNPYKKVQIRESTEKGSYLDTCIECEVGSVRDVMEVVDKGIRHSHISATLMNDQSSRSHTVFIAVIKMIQTLDNSDQQIIKTSRFHIVDLAGSEQAKETGTAGQVLKQAGSINISLSTLSNIIYELAEQCDRSKKSTQIRYRDSKLTYLLKDSLGGNSQTVMICNVNPHHEASQETCSTLSFAERVTKIKTQAKVNEEIKNPQYWRQKYLELYVLIKGNKNGLLMAQTMTNNLLSMDGSFGNKCQKCSSNSSKTSKIFEDHQIQKKEVLTLMEQIKKLNIQLKEERLKREDSEQQLSQALSSIHVYRQNMDFKLKLKESSISKLTEHFKRLPVGEQCSDEELKVNMENMIDLVENFKLEIENTNAATNNLIAAKEGRIETLSKKIQELQDGSEDLFAKRLQKTIETIEELVSSLQNQNIFTRDQDPLYASLDVEIADASNSMGITTHHQNTTLHLRDQTLRRDHELANFKIHYQELIDVLKQNLEREQSKCKRLQDQLNSAITQAYCQFNEEEMLILKEKGFGNTHLMSQMRLRLLASQIIQDDQQAVNELNIKERMIIMEDYEKQILEKLQQIEQLSEENAQGQQRYQELYGRYEQAKQDLMGENELKFAMEDQLDGQQRLLSDIQQDNERLYEQLSHQEQLIEDMQKLQSQNHQLLDELKSLQCGYNDQMNTITHMSESMKYLEEQFELIQGEKQKLSAQVVELMELQASKVPQHEQLQQQLSKCQNQFESKDQEFKKLNNQLNKILYQLEEMKQSAKIQQQVIKDDLLPQLAKQGEELREMELQLEQKDGQLKELEEVLARYEEEVDQFREKERVSEVFVERMEYENKKEINEKQDQIKQLRQELLKTQAELQEAREDVDRTGREIHRANKDINNGQRALAEEREKSYKLQQMLDQHLISSNNAIEAITKYRVSQSQKNRDQDQHFIQLTAENKEMRELMRERGVQLEVMEDKLRKLQELRDKFVRDNHLHHKIQTLEKENLTLNLKIQEYLIQVQAKGEHQQKVRDEVKEGTKRQQELEGRYMGLIMADGTESKIPHFMNVKNQSNTPAQQLQTLQLENEKMKQFIQMQLNILGDMVQGVEDFRDKVCEVFKISKAKVEKSHFTQPECYIQQVLSYVLDIIGQGFTNLEQHQHISNISHSQAQDFSPLFSSDSYNYASYSDNNLLDREEINGNPPVSHLLAKNEQTTTLLLRHIQENQKPDQKMFIYETQKPVGMKLQSGLNILPSQPQFSSSNPFEQPQIQSQITQRTQSHGIIKFNFPQLPFFCKQDPRNNRIDID